MPGGRKEPRGGPVTRRGRTSPCPRLRLHGSRTTPLPRPQQCLPPSLPTPCLLLQAAPLSRTSGGANKADQLRLERMFTATTVPPPTGRHQPELLVQTCAAVQGAGTLGWEFRVSAVFDNLNANVAPFLLGSAPRELAQGRFNRGNRDSSCLPAARLAAPPPHLAWSPHPRLPP